MFTLLEKQTIFNLILNEFDFNNKKVTHSFLNKVAIDLEMSADEFAEFRGKLTNLDQISLAEGIKGIFNDKVKMKIYEEIMDSLR